MSLVRFSIAAATALLLAYGAARYVDAQDGSHGPGAAWNVGHIAFLLAFVLFGVIIVRMRRAVIVLRQRAALANASAAAGLVGVLLFLWVILTDLSPNLDELYELPDPVMLMGPLLFQLGLVVPLAQLSRVRPGKVSPLNIVSVLLAFGILAVNLDLLAVAAVLLFLGFRGVDELDERVSRATIGGPSRGRRASAAQ